MRHWPFVPPHLRGTAERSFRLTADRWRRSAHTYGRGLFRFLKFGPGALAAAGAANLFTKIPHMARGLPGTPGKHKRPRHESAGVLATEPAEYTKFRTHIGHYKKRDLRHAWKRIAVIQQPVYCRFQGINQFNSVNGGYFQIPNFYNTTAGTGVGYMPLHFYDLSNFIQNKAGAISYGTVGISFTKTQAGVLQQQYLGGSTTTGNNNIPGTDASGAATQVWTVENAPQLANALGNAPLRHDILKWADIRFMLYGIKNSPVKYDISLVQFPEDEYNFIWQTESLQAYGGTTGSLLVPQYDDALLEYLLRPFMENPIAPGDNRMKSKIKFLKHWSFTINGGMTTENDTAPHYKEVRIFDKMDRTQRYDWADYIATAINANTLQNSVYSQHTGQLLTNVHPKARIYLMVRCLSPPQSGTSWTFANTKDPSYDLFIRKKHLQVQ